MTYEHRIVVSLDEIKSVIFECNKCGSRICRPPDRIGHVPFSCDCGHTWRPEFSRQPGIVEPLYVQFVAAIQALRLVGRENPLGFKIFLEFEAPNAG
jgi:hypothetical protein